MQLLPLLLGSALLAVALVDVLWTTLWPDGGSGPVSGPYTNLIWRSARRASRTAGRGLNLAGPVVLLSTLVLWIALLWAGWVLVFASDPNAIVPSTGTEVSWTGRIYYVAYSMFTMGNGDFNPTEGWPQLATSLTTATGMIVVTLGVTYLLSVIPAVAQKRSFAAEVSGIGRDPEDLIITAWDGDDLHSLDVTLGALSSQLGLLADKHKAFPVLHHYHPSDRADAAAVAVAVLDEALTIAECGIDGRRWNPVTFRSARSAVDGYLSTLRSAYLDAADEAPPLPDLDRIRAAGIPTVGDDVFASRVAERRERRRALLGMVRGDAWEWRS